MSLRPTPEQYRAFSSYLCEAHSWYKHLSLLQGGQFVVFLSNDAGVGRLVARPKGSRIEDGYTLATPQEEPEFTEENPRLHYGWKTTKEYRSRFGHLDYMYRHSSDEPYCRDAGRPIQLPQHVEERCTFVLYPYVSGAFADFVLGTRHDDSIQALRLGSAHPAREEVLELIHFARSSYAAWCALNDVERNWVLSQHSGSHSTMPPASSVNLNSYIHFDEGVTAISRSLHSQELKKIEQALAELDEWLLHVNM
jgi:hypothetical protein